MSTRTILLGLPNSGRTKLAQQLAGYRSSIEQPTLYVTDSCHYWQQSYQLGLQTDYRYEMALASLRAMEVGVQTYDNNQYSHIFTHSLIDSLAHSAVRYFNMSKWDNVKPETLYTWWLTSNAIGRMFKDSFQADRIIRVINDKAYSEAENQAELDQIEEAFLSIQTVYDLKIDNYVYLHSGTDYGTLCKDLTEGTNESGDCISNAKSEITV